MFAEICMFVAEVALIDVVTTRLRNDSYRVSS